MIVLKIEKMDVAFKTCHILSIKNLSFESGHINVIKGENGKGKTLFLTSLLSKNEYINAFKDAKNISTIGNSIYVSSKENLFDELTPLENLAYYSNKALNIFNKFNVTINLNERTSYLSGGEEEIISIAVALSSEKDILLLDESTNFLDDAAFETYFNLINEYSKKHLVIVATHDSRFFSKDIKLFVLEDKTIKLKV